MLSPNASRAMATIAGPPTGCMSQVATNGQPPRNHSRACNRYKPSSGSITEVRKEAALSKEPANSKSNGGHIQFAEKSKGIPRTIVALFVIYLPSSRRLQRIFLRARWVPRTYQ